MDGAHVRVIVLETGYVELEPCAFVKFNAGAEIEVRQEALEWGANRGKLEVIRDENRG